MGVYPPVSSNMACWKIHENTLFSSVIFLLKPQFQVDFPACHGWWPQGIPQDLDHSDGHHELRTLEGLWQSISSHQSETTRQNHYSMIFLYLYIIYLYTRIYVYIYICICIFIYVLYCIVLYCIALHCIALHCIALHACMLVCMYMCICVYVYM